MRFPNEMQMSRPRVSKLHFKTSFLREFCGRGCENERDEGKEEGEDVYRINRGFEERVDGEDEEGKSGGELQRFGRRLECALD